MQGPDPDPRGVRQGELQVVQVVQVEEGSHRTIDQVAVVVDSMAVVDSLHTGCSRPASECKAGRASASEAAWGTATPPPGVPPRTGWHLAALQHKDWEPRPV